MQTFFGGSATDAVAAILDVSASKLTDDDLQRLEQLIEQAARKASPASGSLPRQPLSPRLTAMGRKSTRAISK